MLGGKPAVIAMLDLFNNQVVSVDIDRDHGFLEGMGINPGNPNENGQEAKTGTYTGGGKYTIACHQPTQGAIDGGRTAMENCLSANPDINVVYAINEPAAEGAYAAIKAAGKPEPDQGLRDRRQLRRAEAGDQRRVRGRRGAVPGQDGRTRHGGDRQARPRRDQAVRLQRPVVLRHRDRAGGGHAVSGVTTETPAQGASACWGS